MNKLLPFRGFRPTQSDVDAVIAPPYDVFNAAQARAFANGNEKSFLHVTKSEIDFEPSVDPYGQAIYDKAAENLQHMIKTDLLQQDDTPCFYVYRITQGNHSQTGFAATVAIEDYDNNVVRKHEFTRPVKENDRTRHIETCHAQTGAVLLTYRAFDPLDQWLKAFAERPAELTTSFEESQHDLWVVHEPTDIDTLQTFTAEFPCLYIADGHHRCAAAARAQGSEHLFAVMFPDQSLKILGYHRIVKDLNGLTPEAFLAKLKEHFSVTPSDAPVDPETPASFGLYLNQHWYTLTINQDARASDDPVENLDVSLLSHFVMEPLLDITDPRKDPRVDFVGGSFGLSYLQQCVDSGDAEAAFSLHPTSIDDLLRIADNHGIMPPKSTWFDPKLVDGLLVYCF